MGKHERAAGDLADGLAVAARAQVVDHDAATARIGDVDVAGLLGVGRHPAVRIAPTRAKGECQRVARGSTCEDG